MFYIGAHLSISKGLSKAVEEAITIGANTFQFFSRNPRGTQAKALDVKDIARAQDLMKIHEFGPLLAHAPYILNLASKKDDLWNLAIHIMGEDLQRMDIMGVPYMAFHPGSHVGEGIAYGITRIAEGINQVFETEANCMLLLETMSGSGSEVGGTFEELAEIISLVEQKDRIGVCLDTCHIFGAGYALDGGIEATLEHFNQTVGLSKLKTIHLNDSQKPFNSKKDRHANLGEGLIGLEEIINLVQLKELEGIPLLLETPGGIETYQKEIKLLKEIKNKI
jgi:deoxyribonuclease-4